MDKKQQMNGLRFLSFLGIFLYHIDLNRFWFGSYAVPLFFVLSGFLITRILLKNQGNSLTHVLFTFYARRFLRIFPAYYLLLGVLFFLGKLLYVKWNLLYIFNIKLFILSLSNGLEPVLSHWHSSGIHFWTLCIEEQFYLIYPLILLFTFSKWRQYVLIILIVVSIVSRFALRYYFPESFYGTLLPVCGEYLAWGSLISCPEVKAKFSKISPSIILYSGLTMLIFLVLLGEFRRHSMTLQFQPTYLQTFYGIGFSLLVLGLWTGDNSILAKCLSFKPLVYLGKISYGLYLIHLFTWELASYLTQIFPFLHFMGQPIIRFVLTVILASLSWHFYESPINELKRYFPYHRKNSYAS